jgi:hypothetical protein
MAPPEKGKQWAPRMLFAVKVASGDTNDPVDQALLKGVHTWAQLAVLGHNSKSPKQPLALRSLLQDKVRVRYLHGEGVFPPGLKPAFALKSGYLVLASSPEEVGRFKITSLSRSDATPLMRISAKTLRGYLKNRRDSLAEALAVKEKTTKEKSIQKIDHLRGSLELIDRIELLQKTQSGQVTLTLTVQTAQALKK